MKMMVFIDFLIGRAVVAKMKSTTTRDARILNCRIVNKLVLEGGSIKNLSCAQEAHSEYLVRKEIKDEGWKD